VYVFSSSDAYSFQLRDFCADVAFCNLQNFVESDHDVKLLSKKFDSKQINSSNLATICRTNV
jgi:hypothetical protein